MSSRRVSRSFTILGQTTHLWSARTRYLHVLAMAVCSRLD